MIDLLPLALPSLSVPVPAPAPGVAVPGGAGFAQALVAFLDTQTPPTMPLLPVPGERQAVAEDGNDLPAATDDAADALPDPACIAAFAVPLPPAPPPQAAGAPDIAVRIGRPPSPVSDFIVAPVIPPPEAVALPPAPAAIPDAAPRKDDLHVTAPPPQDAVPDRAVPRRPAAPATASVVSQNPDPAPIAVSAVAQPAHRIFAAAIAAASGWRERTIESESADPFLPAAPSAETVAQSAVPAAGAAQDAPLDLGNERGLERMIDRIAQLREAAGDEGDARDTRIRLVPDRLGAVDIAVRREGDAVRVHFTAERAETQTLLADAQPRLSELAAQRGIRIAEASISTGTPSQQQSPPQQHASPTPRARMPHAPAAAETPDTAEDTRLA